MKRKMSILLLVVSFLIPVFDAMGDAPHDFLADSDIAIAQQLNHSLVLIDNNICKSIIELAQCIPHYEWSQEFRNVCQDIANEGTVAPYEHVARVIDECLDVCKNISPDQENPLQTDLENYKTKLEAGNAHLYAIANNEVATRKIKKICKLCVGCLAVTGHLFVNGVEITGNGATGPTGATGATGSSSPFAVTSTNVTACNDAVARFDGTATTVINNAPLRALDVASGTQPTSPLLADDCLTTNLNLALVPKGTGALTAAVPDGTATGGNARGTNAVDLQIVRPGGFGAATQVASGANSVIGGGRNNTASGSLSVVNGGEFNSATGIASTVGGGEFNASTADTSTVGGGVGNTASGVNSTVGGGNTNAASNTSATVGGGNNNTASNTSATVSGGNNNTASNTSTTVGGGSGNNASGANSTVGGGNVNTASGANSTVGGGNTNTASNTSATVGGGEFNIASNVDSTIGGGSINTASGLNSTVGGGNTNTASGLNSTVSGGDNNTASNSLATVSGGFFNIASGLASLVGGGDHNLALGDYSTVDGGFTNTATGFYATIPGGKLNQADGDYSFAAGFDAHATNTGSFVWADSTNAPFGLVFTSTANNQFRVRATGGAQFITNSGETTGVSLEPAGSSWGSISDRNRKENFKEVDTVDVLNKLMSIPMLSWNYKGTDESIRHIGPMAQDFNPAFDFNEAPLSITTLDFDGVALAAIQGLYRLYNQRISYQNDRISYQDNRISYQDNRINDQDNKIEYLENIIKQLVSQQQMTH